MKRQIVACLSIALLTACGGSPATAVVGNSTSTSVTTSSPTQTIVPGPSVSGMPWLSLAYDKVLEGDAATAAGAAGTAQDGFKMVATTLWITNLFDQWQYLDSSPNRAAFQFQDSKGGFYNASVMSGGAVPLPPKGSEQLVLSGQIPSARQVAAIRVTLLTDANARVQVDLVPNPAGVPSVPLPNVGTLDTSPSFDCAGAASIALSDIHRDGDEFDATTTITNEGNTSQYPSELVNGTLYVLDANGTRIFSDIWSLMKAADSGKQDNTLPPDQQYVRTFQMKLAPSIQNPQLIVAYVYLSEGNPFLGAGPKKCNGTLIWHG